MNHHVSARSGRNDDGSIGCGENVEGVSCGLARLRSKARVVGRLAAAGEAVGQRHLEAEPLEHTHHGHTRTRIDLVDEARREQLDDAAPAHANGTTR